MGSTRPVVAARPPAKHEAAYRRTVVTHTEVGSGGHGLLRTVARVDDWFHGFEITLDVLDGVVVRAEATAHRHPWSTCPGALASVAALEGPVSAIGARIAHSPRSTTCVHVNDMVWLAAKQHAARRYDIEMDPTAASLSRDGIAALHWPLDEWKIADDGPFRGLAAGLKGWSSALGALPPDDSFREAVRMLRRGLLVGTGYYTLPWGTIERGTDVLHDSMPDSCHAFSRRRITETVCIATVPPPHRRSKAEGSSPAPPTPLPAPTSPLPTPPS